MWPGSRLLYFDLLAQPRYEDYNVKYQSGNPFGFLGNGFTTRESDGRDLSYYLGTKEAPGALLTAATPAVLQKIKEATIKTSGVNGVNGVHLEEEIHVDDY